jgi:transposase InsO family protein
VEEYLEEEGIKHEFSAPYTPQQNGVVREEE